MRPSYSSFQDDALLATGTLAAVTTEVMLAMDDGSHGPFFIFDDTTGRTVELDLRGTLAEVLARLPQPAPPPDEAPTTEAGEPDAPRGRGRPKLGVVAREVTLLPRHWDWLATQPGGASVALRRLVETARRTHAQKDHQRAAHERAYHVMASLAGNRAGFEEASRALFANDQPRFEMHTTDWPAGLRGYLIRLGFAPFTVDNETLPG